MPPSPDLPLVASRPEIEIDGAKYPSLSAALKLAEVTHSLGMPAALNMHLGVQPARAEEPPVELHAAVRLRVGDELLFAGRITAIEQRWGTSEPPVLVLEAHDALRHAMTGEHVWQYANETARKVLSAIAQKAGLTLQANAALLDRPHTWSQIRQTDLQLLTQIAAHCCTEFWCDSDSVLHVEDALSAPGATQSLRLGETLQDVGIRHDLLASATGATAAGWDMAIAQAILEQQSSLGTGSEATTVITRLTELGLKNERIVPIAASSVDHATALASGTFTRHAFRYLQANGIATDSPWLKPGHWLALEGIDRELDTEFYLRSVTHHYTPQDGLQTRFLGERPSAGHQEVRRHAGEHRRDSGDHDPSSGGPPRPIRTFDTLFSFLGRIRR